MLASLQLIVIYFFVGFVIFCLCANVGWDLKIVHDYAFSVLYLLTPSHSTLYNVHSLFISGEPGSLASIVSGYRLDDWAIEVRFPADAKGFFL
jgi:hypothetical protein